MSNLFYNAQRVTGNTAITVSEDTLPTTCTATAMATAPATCSTCNISAAVSNVVCNGEGTASTADDTYTFTLMVTDAAGTGTTWSGNGLSAQTYGTPVTMGPYLISAGNTAITVSEDTLPATCNATVTATAPGPCSTLSITASVTNIICNGQGTTDASDDTFTFSLTVTNLGGGTTWSGNGFSTQSYGVPITMGPYLISGGNISISVADDVSAIYTALATAIAPSTCSTCNANAGTFPGQ